MAEETLYDSEAMRRLAGIERGCDRIPDETTILNFRHLLERHGPTQAIFAEVNAHLADKGIPCARACWWMHRSSTRRPSPERRSRAPISCTRTNPRRGCGDPLPTVEPLPYQRSGPMSGGVTRTGLPANRQTGCVAGLKRRNPPPEPRLAPAKAISPPSRRNQMR